MSFFDHTTKKLEVTKEEAQLISDAFIPFWHRIKDPEEWKTYETLEKKLEEFLKC